MAQLIATINGKAVYSDKGVDSIINTRITFTDGSWCDVSTGAVVNRGPGYINIGAPAEGSEQKVTRGPDSFTAKALDIRDIAASVTVEVHDQPEIVFSAEGTEADFNAIDLKQEGDTIVLSGKGGTGSGRGSVHIGGSIGATDLVSIGGGVYASDWKWADGSPASRRNVRNTVIIGGGSENSTAITVKVPKGTPVTLDGVTGDVTVGDTEGSLNVNVQGQNEYTVGRVGAAAFSTRGQSRIHARRVDGTLAINLMGQGEVTVDDGKVSMLTISVMGQGDARFNGQAENASLSCMGQGDVYVSRVTNRPSVSRMGQGDVTVGNWR